MYQPTLEKLGDRSHCIAVDLPGLGGSFDPPEFDSISALTEYTMEFLDALGIERYHAFGNHTGAGMAGADPLARSPRTLRNDRDQSAQTRGRRSAQGRSTSSCDASRRIRPSSWVRPVKWTPTGSPSSLQWSGSETAGWPLALAK